MSHGSSPSGDTYGSMLVDALPLSRPSISVESQQDMRAKKGAGGLLHASCIQGATAPEPAHARSVLPVPPRVSHAVADGAAPTDLGGTRARPHCETRARSWRCHAYVRQCTRRALALR